VKKILSEHYVTIAEVKEIMAERKKVPPFDFEQEKTLDYAIKFARLGKAEAAELQSKLAEIVPPALAVKIADIVPANAELLKLIFLQEKMEPEEALLIQVLAIVKEYTPTDIETVVREEREKTGKLKAERVAAKEKIEKDAREAADAVVAEAEAKVATEEKAAKEEGKPAKEAKEKKKKKKEE